jgi:hypothetical protein
MPWVSSFIGLPVFAITATLLLVIGIGFIVLAGLDFIMAWGDYGMVRTGLVLLS